MSTRNLTFVIVLLLAATTTAQAQLGNRLGNAARNAAERAATRQTERRTEQAVDKAIDSVFDGNNNNNSNNNNSNNNQQSQQQQQPANAGNSNTAAAPAGQQPQQGGNALEMTYAKSDFVAGDEIIFEDNLVNEKMGEFPSQWDLIGGNAEVANFNGVNAIFLEAPSTHIAPLMKNMKSYLPDVFTVEFDYWVNNWGVDKVGGSNANQKYSLIFYDANNQRVMLLEFGNESNSGRVNWNYRTPEGESRNGNINQNNDKNGSWNHISVSFNKRAFKAYVNGERVTNIPSMSAPVRLSIERGVWQDHRPAIVNIRIAQGAVPLYDRMLTDGKFITYGITFDVGKSTIKPESMGEINRIVQLMNENPTLKFSVEGHTDSTGNAASNQTLSEARSQAVVDKLVENGIARDRLSASGKGQTSPIADNGTDEGRAKNRRVEFVKIN